MTASNHDGDKLPIHELSRPAQPARLSVADFAQSQRQRSRDNAQALGNTNGLSNAEQLRRSASGSSKPERSGRFASLRKKMSKSKPSSGFLLDGDLTAAAASPRPSSSLPNSRFGLPDNHRASTAEVMTHGQSLHTIATNDGASESRLPRDGDTSTPQSKRNTYSSLRSSPASIGLAPPSTHQSPRASTEHSLSRPSGTISRPASAAIDPSQLVRMALNLSESRRMQLDPGHLPSIPVAPEPRLASGVHSSKSSGIEASRDRLPSDSRSSPRPATGSHSLASSSRQGDTLTQGSSPLSSSKNSVVSPTDAQPDYIFSQATLDRAQRARKYMELSAEYRRLLQSLPPLQPIMQSGVKSAQMDLGRTYNTLQYIRNRRSRREHNAEFDSVAEGWDDPSHVRYWVDSVEREAKQPGYLAEDIALLPKWSSGLSRSTNPESEETKTRQNDAQNGKKESGSKRFEWQINPSDLLKDAYWLEQDQHKTLIASKHGHKIFHSFSRPLHALQPRRDRSGTNASAQSRDSSSSGEAMSPVSKKSHKRMNSNMTEGSFEDLAKAHRHQLHGTGRVRNALFRRRAKSNELSDDGSDTESTKANGRRSPAHRPRANIGPLEKHMQAMIEQESRNEKATPMSPKTPPSALNSPEGSRRHGISEGSNLHSPSDSHNNGQQHDDFGGPLEEPFSAPPTSVPRISVETYDEDDHPFSPDYYTNGHAKQPMRSEESFSKAFETLNKKRRSTRLGFWSRTKSKRDNQIDTIDFASQQGDYGPATPQYGSEWDSGMESLGRKATAASTTDGRGSVESDFDTADSGNADRHVAGTMGKAKTFKGGRIGELVRNESSAASNIIFKRQGPRQQSPEKRKSPTKETSDAEETRSRPSRAPTTDSGNSRTSSQQRSPSKTAASPVRGTSPQYHIRNLPTFQTQASRERSQSQPRSPGQDHISKQQEDRRMQRINSRLSSIAPSSIDTSDLGSSSREISRVNTRETGGLSDRRQSYGFANHTGSAAAVRAADKRLSAVMNVDEETKIDPPKSPLFTTTRVRPHRTSSSTQGWSIEKVRIPKQKVQERAVAISSRDVAQVRSLLLSAGVKAQAITRKADEPRDEVTSFLKHAFESAGQDPSKLGRMSIRQAHVLAAQLISDHLSQTLHAFDNSVVKFRSQTCQRLTEQIDDLRDRATSDLMPKVQSAGGEADAFVARLTTTHTLAIRQVMDGVDKMMRKRRRRLRYVQRQLFTLLEWVLVALMWWIWLIVFVLRIFRGTFTGSFRLARWLLWL